jgi:hypothetical protein
MCFQQIYQDEPLEPGQIDLEKADQFNSCCVTEILDQRRKAREERIQALEKKKEDSMNTLEEDETSTDEGDEESS